MNIAYKRDVFSLFTQLNNKLIIKSRRMKWAGNMNCGEDERLNVICGKAGTKEVTRKTKT
jgi:hypothetical protein